MKIENELKNFTGTEEYHTLTLFKTLITDGVVYLMGNGYSWFVTDALSVIEMKPLKEDFLAVKLTVKEGKVKMIITDGNEKVLWKQDYNFTDSDDGELTLFWESGVLLLAGEH